MLQHGIEDPGLVRHEDTLGRQLSADQQILGSGSPTSMSIMRVPPKLGVHEDHPRRLLSHLPDDLDFLAALDAPQHLLKRHRRIWEVPVVSGLNLFFLPAFDKQGDQQQEQCGYCHPRPP